MHVRVQVGFGTENFDKMVGNPICKKIDWDENEEFYRAWETGATGYPWIDAIMRQLNEIGWMHHLVSIWHTSQLCQLLLCHYCCRRPSAAL